MGKGIYLVLTKPMIEKLKEEAKVTGAKNIQDVLRAILYEHYRRKVT